MRASLVIRSFIALALALLPATVRAQPTRDFGAVSVTSRPPNADVFVDGERWVSPEASGPLVVQLAPGRHQIEVRADGYRPFRTVVDVRAGETTPVNVVLPIGPARREAAVPPPPPGAAATPRISEVTSEDGFVFAPDFRVTELNHRATGLAGFYGGYVFGGQLMLGGGAYFQLADHHSEQLAYGGAVAEWRLFQDRPVGLNLQALAGYGQARTDVFYAFNGRNGHMDPYGPGDGYRFRVAEEFWVGEPQAQVVARFGGRIRLVAGAGYRFTSADSSNLNGVSGSVSLQIGK
jgi:hypothetical protein